VQVHYSLRTVKHGRSYTLLLVALQAHRPYLATCGRPLSAFLWSLDTILYSAGKRAASDIHSVEIKFFRLSRLDGKKEDDYAGGNLGTVLCRGQNGFTWRTSGQSAGSCVIEILSVTQVSTEVRVFRDVMQSLRFFKISVTTYRSSRFSILGELNIQNENYFTVHERRRNIVRPSQFWM
jgi:hypothetical protein